MDTTPPASRTSIVTVSYRSGAQIDAMLGSRPPGLDTVIVNNAPEDQADLLKAIEGHDHMQVIANSENTGFGSACNIGARHVDHEFILFLNPDAQLKTGCINALEACADAFPDAVAFNPAMTDDKGRPLFKRSSVLLPRESHMPRGWPPQTREVPVLNGAAFFVRKSAFDQVGGFDEKIFLYHEDDDLSLRLAAQGGKLMFVRDAGVVHKSGHSTARSPEIAALKAFHMGWSRVYATRKHGAAFARARALASATLQALNPAIVLSERKRAKQFAFLKGVLTAIFRGTES